METLPGIVAENFHQFFHGENPGLYQIGMQNLECCFDAHHAEGALFQSFCFFLGAVGRVVGGNHVDGAVQNTLHQRFPVFGATQGGIHLEPSVLL